jgi:hypothetical protein
MTSDGMLPSEFADLEGFAQGWALARESQRNAKRIDSEMSEIQALYDAMFPRLREIVDYLNRFPLESMAPEAKNLLHLAYSMIEVSLPVEVLGQPNMPDSVEDSRLLYLHEQ